MEYGNKRCGTVRYDGLGRLRPPASLLRGLAYAGTLPRVPVLPPGDNGFSDKEPPGDAGIGDMLPIVRFAVLSFTARSSERNRSSGSAGTSAVSFSRPAAARPSHFVTSSLMLSIFA